MSKLSFKQTNPKITHNAPIAGGYYTYSDYITWDDEVRYELIDGTAYALASPSPIHQLVHSQLFIMIGKQLENKKCKIISAPSDIRLSADKKDDTVLQPDLFIFCERSGLERNTFKGTPELVIEITSPSTEHLDRFKKYQKYLQAQVPEYWIVEPEKKVVNVFVLEQNKYNHHFYEEKDTIKLSVIDNIEVNLFTIFNPFTDWVDEDNLS